MTPERYVVVAQRADRSEAQRLADRLRAQQVANRVEERNGRHAVVVRRSDVEAAQRALHLLDKVRTDVPEPSRSRQIRASLWESVATVVAFSVLLLVAAAVTWFAWQLAGKRWQGVAAIGGVVVIGLIWATFQGSSAVARASKRSRYGAPVSLESETWSARWLQSRTAVPGGAFRVRDWVALAIVVAIVVAIVLDV